MRWNHKFIPHLHSFGLEGRHLLGVIKLCESGLKHALHRAVKLAGRAEGKFLVFRPQYVFIYGLLCAWLLGRFWVILVFLLARGWLHLKCWRLHLA